MADTTPDGDELTARSFDDFFRAEYLNVVGLVSALMGSRAMGEDVAQDAFAKAHLQWPRVARFERPDLWVRRVALNRGISVLRRRDAEMRALKRLDRYRAPIDVAESGQPDEALWARVRDLPRRQAQLTVLVYGNDQSIEQAALTLGLAPSTARTHLQRARTKLADALAGAGDLGEIPKQEARYE